MSRWFAGEDPTVRLDRHTQVPDKDSTWEHIEAVVQDRRTKKLSIAFIDLRGLKAINDKFGHNYGDQYLAGFAEECRKALRDDDFFGRIGGDEFVVLAKVSEEEMVGAMERLMTTVGREYPFSYGVAEHDGGLETARSLVRRADELMYASRDAEKRDDRLDAAMVQVAQRFVQGLGQGGAHA